MVKTSALLSLGLTPGALRVRNRAFLLAMVSPSGDTSLVVAFIPKLTLGAFCDRLVNEKPPQCKYAVQRCVLAGVAVVDRLWIKRCPGVQTADH